MRQYTEHDLTTQLKDARAMMTRAGMPDLRLTRTCEDDAYLARMVAHADPFQNRAYHRWEF